MACFPVLSLDFEGMRMGWLEVLQPSCDHAGAANTLKLAKEEVRKLPRSR